LADDNEAQSNQGLGEVNATRRSIELVEMMQGKSTFLPGECLDKLDKQSAIVLESNPVREDRLRWQKSAEAVVPILMEQ